MKSIQRSIIKPRLVVKNDDDDDDNYDNVNDSYKDNNED